MPFLSQCWKASCKIINARNCEMPRTNGTSEISRCFFADCLLVAMPFAAFPPYFFTRTMTYLLRTYIIFLIIPLVKQLGIRCRQVIIPRKDTSVQTYRAPLTLGLICDTHIVFMTLRTYPPNYFAAVYTKGIG